MESKKYLAMLGAMVLGVAGIGTAQQSLPTGTTLPVTLTSSLSSESQVGQTISAQVAQVVVTPSLRIPAGAKVFGRVLTTQAHTEAGSQLSLRFDRIVTNTREISLATGLRAMASPTEVHDAQLPETGPDEGISAYSWTTEQVGGDTRYGTGGPVMAGGTEVGRGVAGGVTARLTSMPGSECAQGPYNTNQLQSLWVFSSGACGAYDLPNLTIRQSGMTAPVGEIVLSSSAKSLKLPSGSGLLLQVVGDRQ
jgi:hypothetical protein